MHFRRYILGKEKTSIKLKIHLQKSIREIKQFLKSFGFKQSNNERKPPVIENKFRTADYFIIYLFIYGICWWSLIN